MVSHSGWSPRKYIIKTVITNTIRRSRVKSVSSIDIRWPLGKGHHFGSNVIPKARTRHLLCSCGLVTRDAFPDAKLWKRNGNFGQH